MIPNGFRYAFGGRFCFWRQLEQILGKEFIVQQCSEFSGHADIICCHQMRVSPGRPRIDVPEAFLPNGHWCPKGVQQGGIAVPEDMGSAIQLLFLPGNTVREKIASSLALLRAIPQNHFSCLSPRSRLRQSGADFRRPKANRGPRAGR